MSERDKEIAAAESVAAVLEALDPRAACRVIEWMTKRFIAQRQDRIREITEELAEMTTKRDELLAKAAAKGD